MWKMLKFSPQKIIIINYIYIYIYIGNNKHIHFVKERKIGSILFDNDETFIKKLKNKNLFIPQHICMCWKKMPSYFSTYIVLLIKLRVHSYLNFNLYRSNPGKALTLIIFLLVKNVESFPGKKTLCFKETKKLCRKEKGRIFLG